MNNSGWMMFNVLEMKIEFKNALIYRLDSIIAIGRLNVSNYSAKVVALIHQEVHLYFMEILEFYQFYIMENLEQFVMMLFRKWEQKQHVMNYMDLHHK